MSQFFSSTHATSPNAFFYQIRFHPSASACEALKLCRCNTHKVMNVFEPNKTFYLHPNKNIGFNRILGLLQIKNVFTKKFQNLSYYYVAKTRDISKDQDHWWSLVPASALRAAARLRAVLYRLQELSPRRYPKKTSPSSPVDLKRRPLVFLESQGY